MNSKDQCSDYRPISILPILNKILEKLIYSRLIEFIDKHEILYKKQFEEAVAQTCSVKKVFLEISQNSQENTCVGVSFLIKLHASNFIKKVNFAKFLKTFFFCRTLPLAASRCIFYY